MRRIGIWILALTLPAAAPAGEADVVDARAEKAGNGTYRFSDLASGWYRQVG